MFLSPRPNVPMHDVVNIEFNNVDIDVESSIVVGRDDIVDGDKISNGFSLRGVDPDRPCSTKGSQSQCSTLYSDEFAHYFSTESCS